MLVEPVVFVQHAYTLCFNGRYRTEQIPHYLKMIIHFTSAAHYISQTGIFISIAGTAGNRILLEDMNVLALHLTVPYKIARSSKGSQSRTDDIC